MVLALFMPLIISSGGNSGSQATSLIIRALALGEVGSRDWWRVAVRELPAGLTPGADPRRDRHRAASCSGSSSCITGRIGTTTARTICWWRSRWALALVGVVTFGSLAGSMLPFVLRRLGLRPRQRLGAVRGHAGGRDRLVIYFTVALLILRGTLL